MARPSSARMATVAIVDYDPAWPDQFERLAAAYARLKRALAERVGDDLAAYTDLKDPACDLIVVAAEDWAAAGRIGQDPETSDSPRWEGG